MPHNTISSCLPVSLTQRVEPATVSHVEAERQWRDKLSQRFCDLRVAMLIVSRMDKASLLAAAAYIAELHAHVARLEDEGRQAEAANPPGDCRTP